MSCKPKCDPANEAIASELKNFEQAFFGTVTKSCVNGEVVWTLPCNLAQGMVCYPRLPNEGVACYILRLFELFGLVASGAWDVNVQYCERAFVTYGGQGYVALTINQGQQPDLFPAVWQLYIAKGATGPAGPPTPSPLTTKGDLFGYDTGDARIPVGADNSALIADSTQALGVKWGLPPSSDTASNLGAGNGVFSSKAGNDYQFKSLIAGTNVTMTPTGTDITINATAGSLVSFTTPAQTITSSTTLTIAHGLGATPEIVIGRLRNLVAENGWNPGEEAQVASATFPTGGIGWTLEVDATNIYIHFGSSVNVFNVIDKTTWMSQGITNAKWEAYVTVAKL